MKAEEFINKVITEYQEHFKKGNTTLGTLPNDWVIELKELIADMCELQKQECAKSA